MLPIGAVIRCPSQGHSIPKLTYVRIRRPTELGSSHAKVSAVGQELRVTRYFFNVRDGVDKSMTKARNWRECPKRVAQQCKFAQSC